MGTTSMHARFGVIAITFFALVGCGETSVSERGSASSLAPTAASSVQSDTQATAVREAGTPIVPADSLDDIARWGSSMLVVSITGEEARLSSSAAPGEVELGRDLAARVEQVLWQHPQAVTTVSAGDPLTIYTFPGFVEVDGQRSPAVPEGAVRMDVDQQYVVAMADDLVDGKQVLTLLNAFLLETDSMLMNNSKSVLLTEAAADLRQLSADGVDSGPRDGESLVQRRPWTA